MRRSSSIVLAALLAIAPLACTDAVGPREAPIEQILFLSTRDGILTDIFRMNVDGTGVENLTRHPEIYHFLSLSPDGGRIAFVRQRECNIWVMNTDGTNLVQLTNRTGGVEDGCNYRPRWSRDGTRIAFSTNREGRRDGPYGGLPDIYVMNADGSNPRNVSRSLGDELGHFPEVASWSADGRVVFEASGITDQVRWRRSYVVNADGTGLRPALNRPEVDDSPFWSPDGSKVAFIRGSDGRRHVYVMNADGSGERQLTTGPYDDQFSLGPFGAFSSTEPEYDPWSPDGTRIAFDRWGDTFADRSVVYVINVDGSGLLRLSDEASEFNGWSAGGKRIAFTKWSWPHPPPSGIPEVFVINADGTGLTNVTNHSAADSHGIWIRSR